MWGGMCSRTVPSIMVTTEASWVIYFEIINVLFFKGKSMASINYIYVNLLKQQQQQFWFVKSSQKILWHFLATETYVWDLHVWFDKAPLECRPVSAGSPWMEASSRHGSGSQRMLMGSQEWPPYRFLFLFEATGISYNINCENHVSLFWGRAYENHDS